MSKPRQSYRFDYRMGFLPVKMSPIENSGRRMARPRTLWLALRKLPELASRGYRIGRKEGAA